MDISIIIVNWNSSAYISACVKSICETLNVPYEIIVIDNASTDSSLEILKTLPGIQLMTTEVNLGFAQANNLASKASSGNVLLFLNPDTEVQGTAISQMYAAVLADPLVGIAGCKLLNSDLSLQTSCVQSFPTLVNQLTDVEQLKLRFPHVEMWGISALFQQPEAESPATVEVVSGACLMIRREVFESVGGFSTDYFMYAEDVDLCHKIRRAGLLTVYVANAHVVHHGGQSSAKTNRAAFGDVVCREAIYTYFLKTRGKLYARAYSVCMLLAAVARLCILAPLSPATIGRDRASIAAVRQKWTKVLRWSIGLERWAGKLGTSQQSRPTSVAMEVTK